MIAGTPEGTRTPDPLLRRQLLYPPELQAHVERVMGLEPTRPAWKAGILPLNYTRMGLTAMLYYHTARALSTHYLQALRGDPKRRERGQFSALCKPNAPAERPRRSSPRPAGQNYIFKWDRRFSGPQTVEI